MTIIVKFNLCQIPFMVTLFWNWKCQPKYHHSMKVHILKSIQFLKQCFARSSLEPVWGYFQLMSAELSLKISWNYPQIVSIKDWTKYCSRKGWTLGDLLELQNLNYFIAVCMLIQVFFGRDPHSRVVIFLMTQLEYLFRSFLCTFKKKCLV